MILRDEILHLYGTCGARAYGLDGVSQAEHALQCAGLAITERRPAAFILAALLHDVGHMVHDLGENPAADGVDDAHEDVGARWLEARLPRSVHEPVRLHVAAKRWLCAAEPAYFDALSSDSRRSLALQGGPMSDIERAAFELLPGWRDAVDLRRYDDLAKVPGAPTPTMDEVLAYLDAVD